MATWPPILPVPLLEGYSATDEPQIIRTSMSSGPQRVSLTSTHYMTAGSASIVLDGTQTDALRNFIAGALAHGANWVDDFPLDTGQGVFEHRTLLGGFIWRILVPGVAWKVLFEFETDERNAS